MPRYSDEGMPEGVVYKWFCKDVTATEFYVGSTESLPDRKDGHKKGLNPSHRDHNFPVYQYVSAHGGWDNWEFVVIDTMEFEDTYDLWVRERHWIEHLKASLNAHIPTRTRAEYREANKDRLAQINREYRQAHFEELKQKKQEYNLANVEVVAQRKKDYREANADVISEKKKEYRAANLEKVREQEQKSYVKNEAYKKAYRSEKIVCECGAIITRHGTRHRQSAKHIKLLTTLQSLPTPDIAPAANNDNSQSGTASV